MSEVVDRGDVVLGSCKIFRNRGEKKREKKSCDLLFAAGGHFGTFHLLEKIGCFASCTVRSLVHSFVCLKREVLLHVCFSLVVCSFA